MSIYLCNENPEVIDVYLMIYNQKYFCLDIAKILILCNADVMTNACAACLQQYVSRVTLLQISRGTKEVLYEQVFLIQLFTRNTEFIIIRDSLKHSVLRETVSM